MVNMDGRIYDPVVGRFLSPDPFVQSPGFTQSLNRYAYCLNNPLSLVDPSGYSWLSRNWKSLVASAVGIVVSSVTLGTGTSVGIAIAAGATGGAAGALTGALLNGANLGQIRKPHSGEVSGEQPAVASITFLPTGILLRAYLSMPLRKGQLRGCRVEMCCMVFLQVRYLD